MDSTKAANYSNVGTFVLTVIVIVLMVIPLFRSADPPSIAAQPTSQSESKSHSRRSVVIAWIMPSLLALSILVAAALHFAAARQRKEKSANNASSVSTKTEKNWADVMAEEDAAKLPERIKEAKRRILFHYAPGSDPYLEIVTDLWNGTVFDLVNFGEIRGHAKYAGEQLALAPRIFDSVEPIFLNLKHAESETLTVRQYVTNDVADSLWANKDRGIAVDFGSVAVSFKAVPRTEKAVEAKYTWWGPRFSMQDVERV